MLTEVYGKGCMSQESFEWLRMLKMMNIVDVQDFCAKFAQVLLSEHFL